MCFSFHQTVKVVQFMAEFTLSTTPIRQPQSLFELVTDLGGEIIGSTGEKGQQPAWKVTLHDAKVPMGSWK